MSEPLLQLLSGAKMFSFDAEKLIGIALVLDLMFAAHVSFFGGKLHLICTCRYIEKLLIF